MHVAIIPDGLRRWAKMNGRSYEQSYLLMCEKLRDYTAECFAYGMDIVSLYLSSAHNFSRRKEDVDPFCLAEDVLCRCLLPVITAQYNVRVLLAGNIDMLPAYLQKSSQDLADETSGNIERKLYLCLAYNPIDEIRFAIKNYHEGDQLLRLLWVTEYVDILIRTGKGVRASSFLPLQCAGHAFMYDFAKLFLDINIDDIKNVLNVHVNGDPNLIQSVDDLLSYQADHSVNSNRSFDK